MHSNTRVEFSQSGLGDSGMLYNVRPITLVLLWLLTTLGRPPTASAEREVCDGESFRASCRDGEDILMTDAKFGRMAIGRCVARDYGELGCHKDVLSVMDGLCSGKQSCEVLVYKGNQELSHDNPCPQDLSPYLDASYRCIKVKQVPSHCPANGEARVAGQQGMIPSHVTDSTGCGDLDTPWVIEASPGQRINVSLVDFGWTTRDSGELQPSSQCDVYGYISERRLGMNNTLCGGLARERHVYYSASGKVEVQLLPKAARPSRGRFLLHFEVVGCPDVKPPLDAWYKRNGSTAVIGCEWSEHSWHLKCEGNTWVGVVGNCSSGVVSPPATSDHAFKMPAILSVGLIIGLAVLVVVLLCVVIFGYICCRRRPLRKVKHPSVGMTAPEYDGQAFLYYPGRPVPIQGHCTLQGPHPMAMGGITQEQSKPSTADELLHIWETPLPDSVTNQQDDSGIVSEPTYASLPSWGTMTGPCQPQRTMPRVATNDGVNAGDVTWPGTRAFYDQGAGWVAIPDSN